MAQPRLVFRTGVRDDLAEQYERMLALALLVDDDAAAAIYRSRLDDLHNNRPVAGLYGWEVGAPPNSGPWTLTADNQLVKEKSDV